ncbi:cytochrome P450 [Rhizophagus irregularis DAOM 181602=DAOM 197198]|nr:cytochrome P450 [Rhizophagus irregularis DAOM 181602=DAOM 197198]
MLVAQADVPVRMDYIITEGRPELTNSVLNLHFFLFELDLYLKALLEESFPKSLVTKYYGTNDWRRHRRIVNPTFRNLPLIVFVEFAAKLLDIMEKVDNKPIEISNLMRRLTLDVLGKIFSTYKYIYVYLLSFEKKNKVVEANR